MEVLFFQIHIKMMEEQKEKPVDIRPPLEIVLWTGAIVGIGGAIIIMLIAFHVI
jgi:hypothetical protein